MKIKENTAKNILHALEGGMVPENGLPYIAVGRKEEIEAILYDMNRIEEGFSSFRLLEGAYGTGKSFMAQLIKNEALLRDFVVMDCDLAPERKLCGTKKEGLETYRTLLSRLSTRECPSGGALEQIMNGYFGTASNDDSGGQNRGTVGTGPSVPNWDTGTDLGSIKTRIQALPHGFDFYKALERYADAYVSQNEEEKTQLLRWFRGEFHNKTEAKKEVGFPAIIEDGNWFSYIKLWAVFFKEAGYTGMYLILDELTQITRNIVNATTREHNFERLLSIYNDCYGNQAHSMGIILCGIPSAIHDSRRGIFSYEALKSRLSSSRLQGDEILGSPIIRLRMLTPEEFAVLLERVEAMHAMLHGKKANEQEVNGQEMYFAEEERIEFVDFEYQRVGATNHLTPREFLRDFLTILNLKAEKRPEDSMKDFLYGKEEMELSPSMIGKGEEEDDEIAMRYQTFHL